MDFPVVIPFVEELGFELVRFENGSSEIVLDTETRHQNSFKVVHGGVSMTLLDVAMAHAARSMNGEPPGSGPGVVTIEMKTSFMRPGTGRLRCIGRLLHRTATMAFCDGEILDEQGQRIAHATGTFKYARAVATAGREIKPLARREPGPFEGGRGSD
ncbi:PaaI family thioesterase [Caldimonas sp. KR1-144]|uniref:PaaI family thioesterase n=1 Tax=Caldimonas sp. KR1-144 TaxID=3400911 RepID=UPI003C11C00B